MKARIKHIALWLHRIAYCRGFGIQSPSAYAFVRYVINEHYPYYAYNTLAHRAKGASLSQRKLMRLYMRVANHVQPHFIIDEADDHQALRHAFMQAGCRRAQIMSWTKTEPLPTSKEPATMPCFIRIDADSMEATMPWLAHIGASSIMVVEGIRRNSRTWRAWRTLTSNEHTGVAFDLYWAGIVMFDLSKYKRCYTINF